jgi:two-component system, cell cycle sensor histidine kinase and response regulator CckA
LFEPFFTTKARGKGTGLGLATVHRLVAAYGGTVHVASTLGQGTSFTVYFPRADDVDTTTEAPLDASPPAAGQTVLVVDDAEELRELVRRLLVMQGYRVLVAGDAAEALEVFKRTPSIDVLLTDVVMQGTSGPELGRQLLARQPGLKAIYMSGYSEDDIVERGVFSQGTPFLMKPFTSEALKRRIGEVLEGQSAAL